MRSRIGIHTDGRTLALAELEPAEAALPEGVVAAVGTADALLIGT